MADNKSQRKTLVKSSRGEPVQRGKRSAVSQSNAKSAHQKKPSARQRGGTDVQDVQRLLLVVTRLQSLFIDEAKPEALFSVLLEELLKATDSEYGFIGEVLQSAEGQPYLRTHAITDIAWNEETKALLAQYAPTLEFRNLKTLFGHVMTTGQPVIANDPAHDPRAGGLPPGHPPMHAFLGLPLYRKAQLTGMVGVANRPGGYDEALVAYLEPFLSTCAQLLEGYHHRQQREKAEAALRESEERWQLAVRGSNDGIWDWNIPTGKVFFSARWKQIRGWEERQGTDSLQEWKDGIHPEDLNRVMERVEEYLTKCAPEFCEEYRVRKSDGSYIWVLDRGVALWDDKGVAIRMAGSESDITERKRQEAFLSAEKQALELVAKGAGLSEVLTFICRTIEEHTAPMRTSVMLLTEDGQHLRSVAAPSLPEDYSRAVDGISIGPTVGSCGSAAYYGKPTIVGDIENDALWKDYLHITRAYDLRACWSQPILSSTGTVLGTFAAYYHEPRTPSPAELAVVERAGHLAAVAIQHINMGEALRESEARFQAFMTHSPAVSFIKDAAGRHLYINPTFERLFGIQLSEIRGKTLEGRLPSEVEAQLRENDEKVLTSGQAIEVEETVPTPDGKCQHWLVLKFPLTASSGEQLLGGIAIDITARKEMESALAQQEEHLRLFIEHSPVSLAMLDRDMRYLAVSRRWRAEYRVGDQPLIGRSHYEIFPEIPEHWKTIHRRCLAGAIERSEEDPFVRADGRTDWSRWEIRPWRTGEGDVGGIVIFSEDITARKQAEDALRESEERFRVIADTLPALLWMSGLDKGCNYFNTRWLDYTGRTMEQELGQGWVEGVHSADVDRCLTIYLDAFDRRASFEMEYRLRKADGQYGWIHDSGVPRFLPDGTFAGYLGACIDITARKQAEEQSRQSEAFVSSVLEHLPHMVFVKEAQGLRFVRFNKAGEVLVGKTRDKLLGKTDHEVFSGHEAAFFAMKDREVLTSGGLVDIAEETIQTPDGARTVHTKKVPIYGEDGSPQYLLGISEDITERIRAEESLRRTQFAMDQAVDAVYWIDSHAKILYANEAASEMLGYTPDEFLRMTVHDLNPYFSPEAWPGWWAETRQKRVISVETVHRTKDGRQIPIDVRVSFLAYGGQEFHCVFVRDITERKRVEAARETLQYAVDRGMEGFALLDSEGRYTYMNEAHARIYGFEASDLIGRSWRAFYDEAQIVRIEAEAFPSLQAKGNWHGELIGRTSSGTPVYVEVRLQRLPQSAVLPEVLMCTCRDITERKRAEEEQLRMRTLLTNVINTTPDLVFVKDRDLRTILCNEVFAQAQGKDPIELLGHTDIENGWAPELVHGNPDKGIRGFEQDDREALSGKTVHNTSDPANINGAIRIFDTFKVPLRDEHGNITGILGIARDVTERKWMEDALHALVRGTGAVTGEAFFSVFVKELAQALHMQYAAVTDLQSDQPDVMVVRAMWSGTSMGQPFSYPLTGTPCEVAIRDGVACYPAGVRSLFPNDPDLVTLQAESYLGIVLRSQSGQALGHIFVIDSNPLADSAQAVAILQIFAARAAAELERIKADEALRASQERFELAVRATNDGVWDWNIVTGEIYWSDRTYELLGLEPGTQSLSYQAWISAVHPEDADRADGAVHHHLDTRAPYDLEYRMKLKDGKYRWFHAQGQAVWDATGQPVRMVGSISDVTDRKAAHEELEHRVVERTAALRQSEQRYAGLVNSADGIILEVDGETYRITFVSRQAERILGYPVEQWLDDPMFWLNHVHPDDQQWALAYCQDQTKQGLNHELEYRMVASDGRIVWIRDSVSIVRDDDGNLKLSCILLDVTKHKEMVERLQLTQYAVDQASDQIFIIGPDGYFRDVNESACRRLGYSKAELLTMSVMDIDPDFPAGVWDSFWTEFTKAKRMQLETRHRSQSGEIYPVEVVANYLLRDGKELDYAIVRDITDRKRHETALLESEERFSKAFNESAIGMALVATDGRWLQVNQALCEIVGYPKTELEAMTFQAITHPDDLVEDLEFVRQLLNGELRAYQMEKRYLHRNGSTVWILLNVSLVRNVDGTPKHFISQIQDISERKHLQDQAVRHLEELELQVEERTAEIATLESRRAQTEKLAALGRLAAGVAHEINNPMAGIKNAFTLVRQAVDPAHPSAEFAGLIDREIARVSSIIQNMYQLCRPESRQAELVELWGLVKDLDILLTPQLQQRRLTFVAEMERCPTQVSVPRGDLVQVLLNLLTNAIECSPEGEQITLSLEEQGEWIRLAVRDQGTGIESEHLLKIFDPFYTTKTGRDQKGMGLGLSVSQSLVQAMGGKIEVDTQVGRGSTFTICLPRTLACVSTSAQSNIIKEVMTHDR